MKIKSRFFFIFFTQAHGYLIIVNICLGLINKRRNFTCT